MECARDRARTKIIQQTDVLWVNQSVFRWRFDILPAKHSIVHSLLLSLIRLVQLKSQKDWTAAIKVDCHKIQIRIHSNLFIYIWRWLFPIHFRKSVRLRERALTTLSRHFSNYCKTPRAFEMAKSNVVYLLAKATNFLLYDDDCYCYATFLFRLCRFCGTISTRWHDCGHRMKRKKRENGRPKWIGKRKRHTKEPGINAPKKRKHRILSLKASSTIEYTRNVIQHSKAWLVLCWINSISLFADVHWKFVRHGRISFCIHMNSNKENVPNKRTDNILLLQI